MIKKYLTLFLLNFSIAYAKVSAPGMINLASGASLDLNDKQGTVAYHRIGQKGLVQFLCFFEGEGVQALLFGDKNFVDNQPVVLNPGKNGPFAWRLNGKLPLGTIKISLFRGDKALVQCKELAV